jgi:hypothetical protein
MEGIYSSFSRSIIAGWQSADSDLPLHIWQTRIPGQQGPGHSDQSRQSQQAVTVVRLSWTRIVMVTVTVTVTVTDLIQVCMSDSGQSWPGPAGGARDKQYDCTLAASHVTISFVHSLEGWQTGRLMLVHTSSVNLTYYYVVILHCYVLQVLTRLVQRPGQSSTGCY